MPLECQFVNTVRSWLFPWQVEENILSPSYEQKQAPITTFPFEVLSIIKRQGLENRDTNALSESCKLFYKWQRDDMAKDSRSLSLYLQHVAHLFLPKELEKSLSIFPKAFYRTPFDLTFREGGSCESASLPVIAKYFPAMRTCSYTCRDCTDVETILGAVVTRIVAIVIPGLLLAIATPVMMVGYIFYGISLLFINKKQVDQKMLEMIERIIGKINCIILRIFHHDAFLGGVENAFPNLQRLQVVFDPKVHPGRHVHDNNHDRCLPHSSAFIPQAEEITISCSRANLFTFSPGHKVKSLKLEYQNRALGVNMELPPQLEKLLVNDNCILLTKDLQTIFKQCPNLKSLACSCSGLFKGDTSFPPSNALETLSLDMAGALNAATVLATFKAYPNLKSLELTYSISWNHGLVLPPAPLGCVLTVHIKP